jgi:hypothetical protein
MLLSAEEAVSRIHQFRQISAEHKKLLGKGQPSYVEFDLSLTEEMYQILESQLLEYRRIDPTITPDEIVSMAALAYLDDPNPDKQWLERYR